MMESMQQSSMIIHTHGNILLLRSSHTPLVLNTSSQVLVAVTSVFMWAFCFGKDSQIFQTAKSWQISRPTFYITCFQRLHLSSKNCQWLLCRVVFA
jgi:hypothetical protein